MRRLLDTLLRLDRAARRKVERLAAREGISLNEALNQLLQRAAGEREHPARRRRYRLEQHKVGFGFDIARARSVASEMSDEQTIRKLKGRR